MKQKGRKRGAKVGLLPDLHQLTRGKGRGGGQLRRRGSRINVARVTVVAMAVVDALHC